MNSIEISRRKNAWNPYFERKYLFFSQKSSVVSSKRTSTFPISSPQKTIKWNTYIVLIRPNQGASQFPLNSPRFGKIWDLKSAMKNSYKKSPQTREFSVQFTCFFWASAMTCLVYIYNKSTKKAVEKDLMLADKKISMRGKKDLIHRFISLLIGLRIFTIPHGDRWICPSTKVTFALQNFTTSDGTYQFTLMDFS